MTREYRRTLSDRESKVLTGLSYRGKTIFTRNDLAGFVEEPKNLLDSLVRKKWILKIRKGIYLIAPFEAGELGADSFTVHSFVIASVLAEPYYVGYRSALNHHGLTDRTPPAVYVATTKPIHSRRILDAEYRFVTIPRKKLFGIEEVEIEKREVKISSREKTIVDCLDHPEHSGGIEEVAKALHLARDEVDAAKLVDFSRRLGNNAVIKRLGYIAETLELGKISRRLLGIEIRKGYSLLDPTLPKGGRIKEKWRLVANTSIDPKRWMA